MTIGQLLCAATYAAFVVFIYLFGKALSNARIDDDDEPSRD